jgi:hypothetical protein
VKGHPHTVKQWLINDLAFAASEDLDWNSFPLTVTFRSGSEILTLDGYWDGGRTWRVRFALPRPGAWEWTATSPDGGLDGRSGAVYCEPATGADVTGNPNYRGHLRVSEDGHFFTYADGTPFLYLGDTCWHMNEERCGLGPDRDGPFYVWMKDRKGKGFTVINHWLYASGHPHSKEETISANEGGDAFATQDGRYVFDQIRPSYYRYVDRRWQALWENGFVMAGPPTWFAKPEHCMSLEQAQHFSRYVMARYGAFNLVWALSGEYSFGKELGNPPWNETATWNALGSFVARHNPYHHPISIHPGPAVYHASSSIEFHDAGWLDHNWLQTGQYAQGLHRVAVRARADYDRAPARPVLHAEGFYEGTPEKGAAMDYQARFQPWVAFLNGACGAVYGACSLWPFNDRSDPRSYHWKDDLEWHEALRLPGSGQMRHVADFFRSLEWWRLVPQRDRLLVNGGPAPMPVEDNYSAPHCAGQVGTNCVIYIPEGNAANRIALSRLPGELCIARWYDPREGTYRAINGGRAFRGEKDGHYTLPERARPSDADWVCLIQVVT